MAILRSTLLAEGSSDRRLIPILEWLLRVHRIEFEEPGFAELRYLPKPPKTLRERIRAAIEQYPCDILFVHRDADGPERSLRAQEIVEAAQGLEEPPIVCVVPVQTQEAWLLIDWEALAEAAGNPSCRKPTDLPKVHEIERIADPKARLEQLLREASGLKGRRLQSFSPAKAAFRMSRLINDYSLLRRLPSFVAFETELREALEKLQL